MVVKKKKHFLLKISVNIAPEKESNRKPLTSECLANEMKILNVFKLIIRLYVCFTGGKEKLIFYLDLEKKEYFSQGTFLTNSAMKTLFLSFHLTLTIKASS